MCVDGKELLDVSDSDFDLSQLRLDLWSSRRPASPSHVAGTTTPLTADEVAENQLMYVVLGTVLGIVVLIVVVCIAMCTWRHQQQPRRAVGMYSLYLTCLHLLTLNLVPSSNFSQFSFFPLIFTQFACLHFNT